MERKSPWVPGMLVREHTVCKGRRQTGTQGCGVAWRGVAVLPSCSRQRRLYLTCLSGGNGGCQVLSCCVCHVLVLLVCLILTTAYNSGALHSKVRESKLADSVIPPVLLRSDGHRLCMRSTQRVFVFTCEQ